ncbi:DNA damage-binding protein 1, partial [Aureobasidium melanogenum]
MAYLASIHRPSSVRHALKLNFLSAQDDTLVVAKANRLEFYAQQQDGLVLQHSKAIYGKVIMLQSIRPASSETDHLFIGTDRYMYFTLSWDATNKQLRTENSFKDLSDRAAREAQLGERCNIDPTRRYMTIEIYEGIVSVVPIAHETKRKSTSTAQLGGIGEPTSVRIPELNVRSSTFLHRRSEKAKPQLALLHEDSMGKVRLKVRDLEFTSSLKANEPGTAELENEQDADEELDLGASHLIPLPHPAYGVLILGETSISYCEEFDGRVAKVAKSEPLKEATIFVAWTQIDDQRFVLADEYGKLYLLMVTLNSKSDLEGWKLDVIGETSRASTLVYLDGGRIFVGSHQGNSQLIQITLGSIEILQTFPNIAPILDFTVMDMGNRSSDAQVNEYSSGQARIVTGSGAFKDGSLRSVRSGVGLEDLGSIGEMENITEVFSLKSNPALDFVDTLVVSFIAHTRVFSFSLDGDVEEVDNFKGLDLSQSTLFATNLSKGRILQITASAVHIVDPESGMKLASWSPEGGSSIAAASVADNNILVSVSGVGLSMLDVSSDNVKVTASRTFDAGSQVACISLSPTLRNTCVVGFWQDASISLLDASSLKTIHSETIDEESIAVPRSLLVAPILEGSLPTLFIGMADGHVVTYSIDPSTNALSSKKSIILGTQQASFKALPKGDGLNTVFAICEHPSLIYGSEGRIVYSAITAEDATCVSPFDAEAFPNAIAIATANELKLAIVDEERTTHVQTLPVNETVRRIAYSADLRAFGMGTIKRTIKDSFEHIESHFKLVDEVAFQELHTFALNQEELVESCIRAKLDDGTGDLVERFVVGTSYIEEDVGDAPRGRILVFEVTEDRHLKLVAEHAVKGACRCLAMCEGRIVAALVKTVVVYNFKYETASRPFLDKVASYRTSTAPIDISVTGDQIAIADLMKSVSVVQYKRGINGQDDTLNEVARHYDTTWGTAVANISANTYLESDAEGNLLVLNQDTNGFSEEDKRRLRVLSDMQLGEMVNRIRHIDIQPTPNAIVIPSAFLATVEGAIYLFATIAPQHQDTLMRLQENMAEKVSSPGNVPFNRYRAYKTTVRESEEPNRFVDGELIERFLDCDEQLQEEIVQGLSVDVEEVRSIVEALRRLH